MTTTTAAAAPPPTKKRSAKKAAKKAPYDYGAQLDAVAAERDALIAAEISAPEHAPKAGNIIARMLLLDFVADCLSTMFIEFSTRVKIADAATRAAAFFVTHPTHPTIETYCWGTRIYSELFNCRQLVNGEVNGTISSLELFISTMTPTQLDRILDFVKGMVFDTVCMMKAYNVLMDVMAKRIDTPELLLTKVDRALMVLESRCIAYNEMLTNATGDKIDTGSLWERAPTSEKKRIIDGLEDSNATLQSLMFSVYVQLRYHGQHTTNAGGRYVGCVN